MHHGKMHTKRGDTSPECEFCEKEQSEKAAQLLSKR